MWKNALLALLLLPLPAWGQPGMNPIYQQAERIRCEQAVIYMGGYPAARSFVQCWGDDATYAAFACSPMMALHLAVWHHCGNFQRQISRPRDLLRVIAQYGDPVAFFAMQNAEELSGDSLDAYLANPMQYVSRAKTLSAGAAEIRNRRMNAPQNRQVEVVVVFVSVAGLAFLAFRWWRKRQECVPYGAA